MSETPLRLIVLARDQSPHVQNAWQELSGFIAGQPGVEIIAAEITDDLRLDGLAADLVVVLGGDGAILRACHQLGRRQLPILGINLGRLGFLADLSPDEFRSDFSLIRDRRYRVVEHLMFECRHVRADGSAETHLGLNEVAVSSAASLRMLDVDLSIDGEPVVTYSCDGLIVSTPVGSTAHGLSAGGPILRQDLRAFVITPICPHTLSNRPLVDHADCVYRLSLPRIPDGAMVVVDGQIKRPLGSGDFIEVRRADVTFKMAKLPRHSYYATLHHKLGWAGQPRYRSMG
ncbi:MAG: NAD(+)/NADH kinase [Planctomycetes bacterium]|nr:NAD(+)/NADH kinase [Planctomycetota bacterium]